MRKILAALALCLLPSLAFGQAFTGQFLTVAPTLTNGQRSPFQMDVNGNLKIAGTINATSAATATAAAPTYVEGTPNPFSMDLSGNLRTLASVSIAANATVDLNRVAGTATAVNNGTVSAGVQRVAIASDNTPFPIKLDQTTPGTTNAVSLKYLNATAVSTGSGTMDAGTQRTALATDSPGIITTGTAGTPSAQVLSVQGVTSMTPLLVNPGTAANFGVGATGAAVPANAVFVGARSGANLTGIIQADTSVAINVATGTTTQLVALSGSTKIYVTSFDVISAGTGNITFEYGTGSTCGTGTTILTGAYNLTAQAGIAKGSGLGPILVVPAGNALCILTTASVQMSGSVSYTQF